MWQSVRHSATLGEGLPYLSIYSVWEIHKRVHWFPEQRSGYYCDE